MDDESEQSVRGEYIRQMRERCGWGKDSYVTEQAQRETCVDLLKTLDLHRKVVVIEQSQRASNVLLRGVMLTYLEKLEKHKTEVVPVCASLRELHEAGNLSVYLQEQFADEVFAWMSDHIRLSNIILLLDGLDLVPPEERLALLNDRGTLARLNRTLTAPQARIVLFCLHTLYEGVAERLSEVRQPGEREGFVKFGLNGGDSNAADDRFRFRLPVAEADLWKLVVARLLEQRDTNEEQARDHLRLLEELAFHTRFCGKELTRKFVEETARWLAVQASYQNAALLHRFAERLHLYILAKPKEEEFEKSSDRSQEWLEELEKWELLVRRGEGDETIYEYAIPILDEYFAARHLAARWAEGEKRYRAWESELHCTVCGVRLPAFSCYLRSAEFEEQILLLAGAMGDATPLLQRIEKTPNDRMLLARALGRAAQADDEIVNRICFDLAKIWLSNYSGDWATVDPPSVLKNTALIELGQARNPRHAAPLIKALIEALKGKDRYVCVSAAVGLGKIGNPAAVPALIEALKDEDSWAVLYTLYETRSRPDPGSIEALRDAEGDISHVATEALGKISHAAAVSALIEALKDKNDNVRRAAAYALGVIGNPAAVPALIEALKDKDDFVRHGTVLALTKFSDPAALPALIEALKDEDDFVRQAAAYALREIGNPTAVLALIEALKDKDHHVRYSAAGALGKIGHPAAVPALIEALKDKDRDVGRAVADALRKFSDLRLFRH